MKKSVVLLRQGSSSSTQQLFYYISVSWARNSGRAQLGDSFVPCDVNWGHSVLFSWWLTGPEGPRWLHSHSGAAGKLGSAGLMTGVPPYGLSSIGVSGWSCFLHRGPGLPERVLQEVGNC